MSIQLLLATLAATPASVADLERALDAQPSATRALTEWCGKHGLAGNGPAQVRANVRSDGRPLPHDGRKLLGIQSTEPVRFRHVRLACNGSVLSEAYNWYVLSRLTADMNAQLLASDTPFGTVVAPLRFRRIALASHRGPASACPLKTVLSRRALLRLPDGSGLALLVECYTPATLKSAPGN